MDCIFCNIIQKKSDAAIIWEDSEFTAILDLYPNVKGQTLLISKDHFASDLHDMSDETYARFLLASRKVVSLLKKTLGVKRVALVIEGMGINHAHIKLYPLYGLKKSFQQMWPKGCVFFETYEGYITTQIGPEADIKSLKKLAEQIKKA